MDEIGRLYGAEVEALGYKVSYAINGEAACAGCMLYRLWEGNWEQVSSRFCPYIRCDTNDDKFTILDPKGLGLGPLEDIVKVIEHHE